MHNHRNIWLEGTQSLAHSEPPIQTGYLCGYDGFRPSLHAFLTCIWHYQRKSLEWRKRAASSNDFWKYCIIGGNYKFCRACPVCSPPVLQQNNGVLSFRIYFIFHCEDMRVAMCGYVHTNAGVCRVQKKLSNPLELDLAVVIMSSVGTGNQNWVLSRIVCALNQ